MTTTKLTTEEKNDIQNSLLMWINYIESGDVVLSREDLVRMKKLPKPLHDSQLEKIKELQSLVEKISNL